MFHIEGEDDVLDADMVKLRAMLSRALNAQPTRLERITLAIIAACPDETWTIYPNSFAMSIVSRAEAIEELLVCHAGANDCGSGSGSGSGRE